MAHLSEHRRRQIEMHRQVADMYRRRARLPWAQEFQEERNRLLVSLGPDRRAARVLDLGCGTGILLGRLSERYRLVVGLDLSHEMLLGFDPTTTAPGAHVGLVRGDMTTLPFADRSVDLVFCRSALHHMDDEIGVLREVRRVLRPGGRLVVGEPANDNPLFRLARFVARRLPSFGKTHTIDRAYTRKQLRALFDAAGLEVRREVRFGFVAYALLDNPDLVPVLSWLPVAWANGVARALRSLDRLLARLPVVRSLSWYVLLDVRPREEGTARSVADHEMEAARHVESGR